MNTRICSLLLPTFLLAVMALSQNPADYRFENEVSTSTVKDNASKDGQKHLPRFLSVGPNGKFGFTVPLMTLPGRAGLDFDLSLQYSPGVTVSQEPGWVGMGWTLPIGSVRLNIVGKPDDPYPNDRQRDTYSVSFPGGSATIVKIMGSSGQYEYYAEDWKKWWIRREDAGGDSTRWLITTENGITYVFDFALRSKTSNWTIDPYDALLMSEGEDIPPDGIPIGWESEWLLTSILTADYIAGTCAYCYDPLDFQTSVGGWIAIRYRFDQNNIRHTFNYRHLGGGKNIHISKTQVTYPFRIITPTHFVEFSNTNDISNQLLVQYLAYPMPPETPDPERKKLLTAISVYRYQPSQGQASNGFNINSIELVDSATISYGTGRAAVQRVNVSMANVSPYLFEYYNGVFHNDINSSCGCTGFGGFLKTSSVGQEDDGRNGNLKSIIFPTGARLDLDYAAHQAEGIDYGQMYQQGQGPQDWGWGPKLIRQTLIESGLPAATYSYVYGTINSSGEVANTGSIYFSPMKFYVRQLTWNWFDQKKWLDAQTSEEPYYSHVRETRPDGSWIDSYYNVRPTNDLLNNPATPYTNPDTLYAYTLGRRGILQKKEYYSSTGTKVKMEEFLNEVEIFKSDTTGWGDIPATMSVKKFLDRVVTTTYDENGNNPVNTISTRIYDDFDGLLAREQVIDNTGRMMVTEYSRPSQYRGVLNPTDPKLIAYTQLVGRHIFDIVLAKRVYLDSVDLNIGYTGLAPRLLSASCTLYGDFPLLGGGYPRPSVEMQFNVDFAQYPSVWGVGPAAEGSILVWNPNYEQVTTYTAYDEAGNLLESKDANGTPTTYHISNNHTLASASIVGASHAATATANCDLIDPFWVQIGTVPEGLRLMPNTTGAGLSSDAVGGNSMEIHTEQYVEEFIGVYMDVPTPEAGADYTIEFDYKINEGVLTLWMGDTESFSPETDIWFAEPTQGWQHTAVTTVLSPTGLPARLFFVVQMERQWILIDNIRVYPKGSLCTSASFSLARRQPAAVIDPNGSTTRYTYDALGRISSIVTPSATSDFTYSTASDPMLWSEAQTIPHDYEPVWWQKSRVENDGFGRPIRNIQYLETTSIENGQNYDNMGRLWKQWKTNNIGVNSLATETIYATDPLSRPVEIGAPGSVFQIGNSHTKRINYLTNNASELPGYPANTLSKTVTRDENSDSTEVYTDAFGNTIASITAPHRERLTTRFVYAGNTPVQSTDPKGLSTYYRYNTRGQLLEKTPPDFGTVRTKYDINGNPRFIQDPVQAEYNGIEEEETEGPTQFHQYTYNIYDRFSRLVKQGIYTGSVSFENANPTTSGTSGDFPQNGSLRLRNTYDFNTTGDPELTPARNLIGRVFCTETWNNNVLDAVYYSYDTLGRVEWQLHRMGGVSSKKIAYEYTFFDKVSKMSYLDPAKPSNNHYFFYGYDNAGRLISVYSGRDSDGSDSTMEAYYTWLPGGQVQRVQLGHSQGVDYVYNERDWLTQINHQNLGGVYNGQPQDPGRDGFDSGLPVDKFGMVLGYNQSDHIGTAQNATPQYNGNISWMMYNMDGVQFNAGGLYNPTSLVGYSYSYDKANRLTSADFGHYSYYNEEPGVGWFDWWPTSAFDNSPISYDENGNILTMKRKGGGGTDLDDMTYHYLTHVPMGTENRYVWLEDTYDQGEWYGLMYQDSSIIGIPLHEALSDPIISGWDMDWAELRVDGIAESQFIVKFPDSLLNGWINSNGMATIDVIYGADGHQINDTTFEPLNLSGWLVFDLQSTPGFRDSINIVPPDPPTNGPGGGGASPNALYDGSWEKSHTFQFPATQIKNIYLTVQGNLQTTAQSNTFRLRWFRFSIPTIRYAHFENRLDHVDDAAGQVPAGDLGDQSPGNYIYDANGSIIRDNQREIDMTYDHRQLPVVITKADATFQCRYNASGQRIYKGDGVEEVYYIHDISGRVLAVLNEFGDPRTLNIHGMDHMGQINVAYGIPEGPIEVRTDLRYYYLKDHLGSIRMTVVEGGEVASADDYDPWGLTLNGRSLNNGQDEARWKFIGEEKDAETGDYWFGVRGYDARIGRFQTVDALDELSPHQSPYVYANNNPIFYLDPTGMSSDSVAPTKEYELDPIDVVAYRGQMTGVDWIVFLSDFYYSSANIDYDDVSESWVWYYQPQTVWVDGEAKEVSYASAAVPLLKPGVKLASSSSFRRNLIKLRGLVKSAHAHHMFPKSKKFYMRFIKAGIDPNNVKYGAWWESKSHLRTAYEYSSKWNEFLRVERSTDEIKTFGRKLAREYGLDISF